MSNVPGILATAATVVAFTLNSPGTLAGAADVNSKDGSPMKFEYQGKDRLRINMQEQGSYMLVRDDQVYVVTNSDGQIMVVSLNQAMSMFGSMAEAATPKTVEGKLISLKATGRKETVAGIKGEVYVVKFIDHNGKEQTNELVLSGDSRAVEFQRAMMNMARSMATAANKDVKGADEMALKLKDMNKGVLRYGEDMWISAISDRKIDEARFVLPVDPTDLSALQGILGGGDGESGGGLSGIFGAFGKKSERQQDRVEDKAEREVDKETDEGVDKVLGKAFGKLFGK